MVSQVRKILAVGLLPAMALPMFGQAPATIGPAPDTGQAVLEPWVSTASVDGPWLQACRRGVAGYRLPVVAGVVDWFRPPATQWGAGNRGWEFGTVGGEPVCAVGDGLVSFAGQVAGRGVVSIKHHDGLLSSVTGLLTLSVAAGSHVVAGEPIGEAMAGMHLGFRLDGRYIDPATVFATPTHAILVPIPGA